MDAESNAAPSLSVIMPVILQDLKTLLSNADILFRMLPVKNIYAASPDNVREKLDSLNDSRIIFVNENEFCDHAALRKIYSSRTIRKPHRVNWYMQQFIKMQFSRFTEDDYYLIWDSDTIPIKPRKLFDDAGRPYFDMKEEYHAEYFATMGRILPGLKRCVNQSFISEHMVIKTSYMREMINEIESVSEIPGRNFQEKILNAINAYELRHSGFSEYETYGTYVMTRHEGSYVLRDWHSLRNAGHFYLSAADIDEENMKWLAEKYDAVTIERYHKLLLTSGIIRSEIFRKRFSADILERICPAGNEKPLTFGEIMPLIRDLIGRKSAMLRRLLP